MNAADTANANANANATAGLHIWSDSRGRRCVTLPKAHPYSNSAGYQRLARFLIAEELGYLPRPDEHTHHVDLNKSHDALHNLELHAVAYHGRIHASAAVIARDERGRFRALDSPVGPFAIPRAAAVVGSRAVRGVR